MNRPQSQVIERKVRAARVNYSWPKTEYENFGNTFFLQFFKRWRSPFVVSATAVSTSNYFRTRGRENCGLPTVYGFIVSEFSSRRKRVFTFFFSSHSCCKIRSNVDSVDNRTEANLIGRSACRT